MREKTEKDAAGYVEGTISITGKGLGYVRNKDYKDGIEIEHEFLNTALQGDQVKVLLHPISSSRASGRAKGGVTGEVMEIIMRSKVGFAGVLEIENGIYFLVPSDPKMYSDIVIPEDRLAGAEIGQKVFAKIISWKDPRKAPEGEILKILGKPRENEAEMQAIALEKGFQADFPEDVQEEADALEKEKEITPEEIKKRRDFRNVITFTIDPEDAKDFDDALSFEKLPDGHFEIGIHIADVSHYVRPGTALDREAKKRGTSVYLVDRTIPMLPEILSNDLCSLRPLEDKLAMSAVFEMNEDGQVLKEWFGKTAIHSNKRFTYEEAQGVLDQGDGPYHYELNVLNEIAKKLAKKRFEKGAISLETEEVRFKLDEKGVPLHVYRKTRGDTNKLIEEFMLLANRKVAERIAKGADKVFVYRVHDEPEPERVEDLIFFLKSLGYPIRSVEGKIPAHSINELMKKLEGKEERGTIQTAIVRSMAKAVYSTKNIGHFGLAFEHYTHFTSPIRRYPDTVVHRLLDEYLKGGEISRSHWHEYETVSIYSSQREKEAAEAERASIKYKQVEYMSSRIGQVFDGVITGVTDWGIFAEERETKCEGMIRLKDLSDDFYVFKEREMAIEGERTKKRYRVGDRVRIKVKDANLNKKVIDYVFV